MSQPELRSITRTYGGEWGLIKLNKRGQVLSQINSASKHVQGGTRMVFTAQRYADLAAETRLLFPKDTGQGMGGLVYRSTERGECYSAELDHSARTISFVFTTENGQRKVLASRPINIPTDVWLDLHIRYVDLVQIAWLNGILALTHEHKLGIMQAAEGYVGVLSTMPRGVYYAYFMTSELQEG